MTTSREAFARIRVGMRVQEVIEILGDEGDIVSEHLAQIEPGIQFGTMGTEIREWETADGAVARIMFGGGKVREKFVLEK